MNSVNPVTVVANLRLTNWLALLALLAMLLYRWTRSPIDPDIWHEMCLAREAWQVGYVPWRDSFSFSTTVYPVVHHEWGAGMIAYAVWSVVGWAGICWLRYALLLGLAAICWITARRESGGSAICFYLALPAIVLMDRGFSPVRAQMYSFVFAAGLIWFLRCGPSKCLLANSHDSNSHDSNSHDSNSHDSNSHDSNSRSGIFWWLPAHVAWLNVHAGFLVGSGLFFFDWLERLVRRLPSAWMLACGLVMLLAIMLNPYGWHYYAYLLKAVPLDRPLVHEWDPIWKIDWEHQIVFYASLLLAGYALKFKKNWLLLGWPLLLICAVQAFRHERMLPFWSIVWLSHLPKFLRDTPLGEFLEQTWQRRRRFVMAISLVACLFFTAKWSANQPFSLVVPAVFAERHVGVVYPTDVVEYLKQLDFQPPLRLKVPFDVGGYVSWNLAPRVLVSMDSRYEVAYPPEATEQNWRFYTGQPGWESQLEESSLDAVLVPKWSPIGPSMDARSEFSQAFQGIAYTIYLRRAAD